MRGENPAIIKTGKAQLSVNIPIVVSRPSKRSTARGTLFPYFE